jgi:SSS family solute:Na+ symporter
MMFHNLHIIDIAIIIGYLAVCLVIGFLTSKKIKNIRDYAIGSGHISTAVLVGTFFATDIGAGITVVASLCVFCWNTAGVFFGNR